MRDGNHFSGRTTYLKFTCPYCDAVDVLEVEYRRRDASMPETLTCSSCNKECMIQKRGGRWAAVPIENEMAGDETGDKDGDEEDI